VLLVALIEWWLGRLAPWDRWAYPALFLMCAAGSACLHWCPGHDLWVRRVTVTAMNGYLVVALYMGLYWGRGAPDHYQVISNLIWVPLGYGLCFVLLRLREALLCSSLTYLVLFGPLAWLVWHGRLPAEPFDLVPVLSNNAVAQLVYLVLMLSLSQLRREYLRGREREDLLRQVAHTDPLTGVANRRALNERLVAQVGLLARGHQRLSVLMIDVDHFKPVNDRFGHAAGDAVLVELAGLMSEQLRASDHLGRWGGEEFLVLVPATPEEAALELAERIREAVAEHPFRHGEQVTVSIGVAEGQPGETPEQLVARGDQALYAAKRDGRNRVRAAAEPQPGGLSGIPRAA
jgi:diguanylate cyclase (GGDEF)-like protein